MSRELSRAACVEVEVEEPVAAETPKAIGIFFDGPAGSITWVPKSAIHDDSEVFEKGQTGTLILAEWAAKDRGLV